MGCLLTQIRPATDDSPEREVIVTFFSQAPRLSDSSKLKLFGFSSAVHCFRHYLNGELFLIYCDNSGAIDLLNPTSQKIEKLLTLLFDLNFKKH